MTSHVPAQLFRHAQYRLNFTDELIVDLFAGGGGASTGLEMGLGRPVDIAINHNPLAVSMHKVNHPYAYHYTQDVFAVDPLAATQGRPVGWLHLSPDCTHHSQARGGQPRKKEIRDLAWVGIRWAGIVRPRVISMENVAQQLKWGPLIAKRCKKTGRVLKLDGTVAAIGERVPVAEQYLIPDPKRVGRTWQHFVASLQRLGYRVEWRQLRACDYGAGTRRKRLFLMAMRDGEAVHWPEPTHFEDPKRGRRWSWAADHIDWSDLGVSIFLDKVGGRLQGVRRPLAEATMRRIAKGIKREVLDRAQPFIVSCNHGGDGFRGQAIDEPLCTLTASRDAHGLVVPKLAPFITEHANGSIQRNMRIDDPLRTICAQVKGGHFALATAFLAQANGGFNVTASLPADSPLSVITTTGSQQQLVSCTLSPDDEAGALQVAAFLMQYYGEGGSQSCAIDQPLGVITTRDRLALVTVWISGSPYVIVDIRLRMLKPRELYSCQGFPQEYVIDRGHDGKRFTLGAQTHMCGNSVSPCPMAALAGGNNFWAGRRLEVQGAA